MKTTPFLLTAALALCSSAQATILTLSFATDATGVIGGTDASTFAHDPSEGGRIVYNTGAGWKPNCVRLDFTATQELTDIYAELILYGGKITFTTSIDTTGMVVDTPPDPVPSGWGNPQWFENMVSTNPGENAIGAAWTLMSFYGGTFPLSAPRSQVTTINFEPSETGDNTDKVLRLSPDGNSAIAIGMNSESNKYNSATLYLDDLIIEAYSAPPAIVVPTLELKPATPGLNAVASPPGQYDRQSLRTVHGTYSWVDATSYPVTYSMEVSEYPPLPGHQMLMYFVPSSTTLAANMSYPDWALPLCGLVWITSNANGGGDMRFAYKDDPVNGGGNGSNGIGGHEYWVNDDGSGQGGTLAFATSDTMIGKWSVTFNSATEVTIQTPQGSTASGQFLDTTAAKFTGDVYVYFGGIPGQAANIGQTVVFKEMAITGGVANPFTQALDGPAFDTALLEKSGPAPDGIVQVTRGEAPFWITWSLPATGFGLQHSPSLKVGEWADLPTPDAFSVNGEVRYKLLYNTEISPGNGYLRLLKP